MQSSKHDLKAFEKTVYRSRGIYWWDLVSQMLHALASTQINQGLSDAPR